MSSNIWQKPYSKRPLSLSTNSYRAQPPKIVQVESQLPTQVLDTSTQFHRTFDVLENGKQFLTNHFQALANNCDEMIVEKCAPVADRFLSTTVISVIIVFSSSSQLKDVITRNVSANQCADLG
ncbi:hypothetical protein DAPPUDRAFT_262019 [Daphnia pulex]|uniref:Uncharacterized protein n=1 Tax=Daphnia pulex TaxID=6669 RepID=E9HM57_DAPPU|nr:hypothetical protein DAPPUDRAFT_262019 [Daphnia pulex]|eukprot:EFX67195.1 hypothetical protein DAPPUDRAFT_262019 [Daphnia pulex]